MIRRKKILKLGLTPKKIISKEQQKYQQMVDTILANNAKNSKNKRIKQQRHNDWVKKYSESFNTKTPEPNKDWSKGFAAKKSVFDPVNLNNTDLDEINERRRANNINVPIEVAAIEAIEQAKEKATQVGVAYNKGAYQYLGSGKDVKDLGRKDSQLDETYGNN